MKGRLVLALAALSVVGVSCAYFTGEQTRPFRPPLAEPESADVGEDLYLRDCAWCHGSEGGGTIYGPDLVGGANGAALTDFMLRTGRMPLSFPEEASLHKDPAYDSDEIDALVEHVTALDDDPGPEIPDPNPESGSLAAGAELYLENCAACHSTTGVGGALTSDRSGGSISGLVAPPLDDSTEREISEAILTGPGTMPVFGEETLTATQRDSIVRYVAYLQEPATPGGLSIALIGPVAEGAVAWIVGMGLLLLVVRWIGTKVGEK